MIAINPKISLFQLVLTTVVGLYGASVQPVLGNPAAGTPPSTENDTRRAANRYIRYECTQENQKILTIAHTNQGPIEIIEWESLAFGKKWTPAKRCYEVTERFQTFSDAKQLKYVSTGNMNHQSVICVSSRTGQCMSEGLLITLERTDDPDQVLEELFNLDASVRRTDTKTVVDFNRLLRERPPMVRPSSLPRTPAAPAATPKVH